MERRKKNPFVGENVADYIRARLDRDPVLAGLVQFELGRLELARRVRELREARRLSQKDLADLTGTKQPAIARLESGRVIPRLDLLDRIAVAFGMRLEVGFVPRKRPRRDRPVRRRAA